MKKQSNHTSVTMPPRLIADRAGTHSGPSDGRPHASLIDRAEPAAHDHTPGTSAGPALLSAADPVARGATAQAPRRDQEEGGLSDGVVRGYSKKRNSSISLVKSAHWDGDWSSWDGAENRSSPM